MYRPSSSLTGADLTSQKRIGLARRLPDRACCTKTHSGWLRGARPKRRCWRSRLCSAGASIHSLIFARACGSIRGWAGSAGFCGLSAPGREAGVLSFQFSNASGPSRSAAQDSRKAWSVSGRGSASTAGAAESSAVPWSVRWALAAAWSAEDPCSLIALSAAAVLAARRPLIIACLWVARQYKCERKSCARMKGGSCSP